MPVIGAEPEQTERLWLPMLDAVDLILDSPSDAPELVGNEPNVPVLPLDIADVFFSPGSEESGGLVDSERAVDTELGTSPAATGPLFCVLLKLLRGLHQL